MISILSQSSETFTGVSTIFRFDNLLDSEICDELYSLSLLKINSNPNFNVMPWHDNENNIFFNLKNYKIKEHIFLYRRKLAVILSEKYGINLYPTFTDLVLWRTGRQMPRHLDNGSDNNEDANTLGMRVVSCVTYLNDNYDGGETFIGSESGNDYISKPIKGSAISFLSNEKNMHGVNKVTAGYRITLPIWFCSDIKYSEDWNITKDLNFKYD